MAGYEHALFLILLLIYLLRDIPGRHPASLYLTAGGLLLVLLPPIIRFQIPWNLIFALVLPWVLWKNALQWLRIEWRLPGRETFLWLITAAGLTFLVVFVGGFAWLKAIFFGIVAASMFWQASGRLGLSNPLGNIGPLTLVILLVETSLALEAPSHYAGSLFSGAAVGVVLGLIAIAVGNKGLAKYARWVSLGLVYLAYWTALVIGASAITAALISVLVYSEFPQRRPDETQGSGYGLLDDRLTFFFALALFMLTAWQTHQPATQALWIEAGAGLLLGLLVALTARRMGLPRFEQTGSLWLATFRLALFLLGALILWPRGPELGASMIWIALGSAIFLPFLAATLLTAMRDLNVERRGDPTDLL